MKHLRKVFISGFSLALGLSLIASCDKTKESSSTSESNSTSVSESVPSASDSTNEHVHHYTSETTKDATCTETGVITYTCECGDSYTETIPMTPHTLVHHDAVAADCETAGNIEYWTCSVCAKYFADEEGKNEITAEDVVIAPSHDLVYHPAVAADCETAGNEEYWTCSVCGKYFADEEGKNEITADDVYIAPLDHEYGDWQVVTAPTESESGLAVKNCVRNDDSDELVLPALSETDAYTVVRTEPEVGVTGTITYTYTTEDGEEIVAFTEYLYLITGGNNIPGVAVSPRSGYTFVDDGTGAFVSNNKGVNSSGAYLDIFVYVPGTLTLNYTISSESNYDKGTIYYRDGQDGTHTAVVNGISGTASDTKDFIFTTIDSTDNSYISVQYVKDSSSAANDDCFTISNLIFKTTVHYETTTISYESNGGTTCASTSAYIGGKVTSLPVPAKENLYFGGWYADAAFENEVTADTIVTSGMVLYAKWLGSATLTFNTNGGTTIEEMTDIEPYAPITLPDSPTKENAYFDGWFIDVDCTVPFDASLGIEVDTTIYAKWRDPVVLSFDTNGGTSVESIATDVNVAIVAPADPTKDGFTFAGWYTDADCLNAFVFDDGITENTVVYAKWLEHFTISIYDQDELIATGLVNSGDRFTPTIPASYTKIILDYYTDAAFQTKWTVGSVITENLNLYVETVAVAPDGVLSGYENATSTDDKVYEWAASVTDDSLSFVSTNAGVSNSSSTMVLTFAKNSIVSFLYEVSSEATYDKFTVYVNDTAVTDLNGLSGIANGQAIIRVLAGDVVTIKYTKDGSTNKNNDSVTLSDFVVTDGYPTSSVTYVYNDGVTANTTVTVDTYSALTDTMLAAPANVRDESMYQFDAWYTDENCTKKATTATLVDDITYTLYARWLTKVTVSFVVPDGVMAVENMQVWTYTAFDVSAPTYANHIFRGWYADSTFETPVSLADGVSETQTTLYAKYETLPVGSTMENAYELFIVDSSVGVIEATTTEDFFTFYFKFTPTVTDYYYLLLDPDEISNKVIESSYTGYSYNSDAKYSIVDAAGNSIATDQTFSSTATKFALEGNTTYYITCKLGGSKYIAWGDFQLQLFTYDHDSVNEAISYTFGETAMIQNLFESNKHVLVYTLTTDENVSGDYKLFVAGSGWSSTTVYSDAALTSKLVSLNNTGGSTNVATVNLTPNTTYYITVSNNWTTSELATAYTSFAIGEYGEGYTSSNPSVIALQQEVTTDFSGGKTQYFALTVTEASATYKVTLTGGTTSYTKELIIADDRDFSHVLATYSTTASSYLDYITLPAGTYYIRTGYTSTSASTAYSFVVEKAEAGASILNPIAIVVTSEGGVIESISSISSNGTYYEFTAPVGKFYQFISSAENVTITIYKNDGTVLKTSSGSLVAKLEAETTYRLYLTAATDVESTISLSVHDDWQDGETAETAYVVSAGTECAELERDVKSHTVYFAFVAPADGTYAFYTINNGNIDTKITIYDDAACTHQVAYNDDGGANVTALGGYKYDAYTTLSLVAGQTYYIKVTYSIYSSTTGDSLTLNIVAL